MSKLELAWVITYGITPCLVIGNVLGVSADWLSNTAELQSADGSACKQWCEHKVVPIVPKYGEEK